MNEPPQAFASQRASAVGSRGTPVISAHDSRSVQVAPSRPRYHCYEQQDTLKLVVYIPGADPSGIDLEVSAPDLVITAARDHSASAGWPAPNARSVRHDYQLCLRLGFGLEYEALRADLHAGVLTVTIPKKTAVAAA